MGLGEVRWQFEPCGSAALWLRGYPVLNATTLAIGYGLDDIPEDIHATYFVVLLLFFITTRLYSQLYLDQLYSSYGLLMNRLCSRVLACSRLYSHESKHDCEILGGLPRIANERVSRLCAEKSMERRGLVLN